MLARPATTVTTVKHTVRGLDYQVPANFTSPPNIRAYYSQLVPNARLDAIFAYLYQNYLEAMKVLSGDKRAGTSKNYALFMTTLTVMKEHSLRLSLGDLKQQSAASPAQRKEAAFQSVKLHGCGLRHSFVLSGIACVLVLSGIACIMQGRRLLTQQCSACCRSSFGVA